MCRFLDAGNTETLRTLSEPASKKRQGTKSREVGERLGSERYGNLMLAPRPLAGATLRRRGLHAGARGGERVRRAFRRALEHINGRGVH